MRFSLALDERNHRDKVFEVKDSVFVVDPFTAQVLPSPVRVRYDREYDSFYIERPDEDGFC